MLVLAHRRGGGHTRDKISFSHAWLPRPDTIAAFPDRADQALATFLAKILMPGFFTRDYPDRASPRKPRKPATSPPASQVSPASAASPAESSFHLLHSWQVT